MCNIVIIIFFYKNNWFLWKECIVKTFYVLTKSAGGVFLIPFGVALIRVWLTFWQLWCEGFKICIYHKWNPHWPIVILKRNFRSLFRKFNFDCFVWFTIFMMRCYWFLGFESIKTSKTHMSKWPSFDVCKDNSLLISLIQQ